MYLLNMRVGRRTAGWGGGALEKIQYTMDTYAFLHTGDGMAYNPLSVVIACWVR